MAFQWVLNLGEKLSDSYSLDNISDNEFLLKKRKSFMDLIVGIINNNTKQKIKIKNKIIVKKILFLELLIFLLIFIRLYFKRNAKWNFFLY